MPGPFIASPHVRSGAAAFRLFNGAVPPTLSIRDQVAIAVAERIVEQKLAPATRIREQLLAEEFGVSKAPVNEALTLLEHAGLVDSAAHRSAYVSAMSAADFDELVAFRLCLARDFLPRFAQAHSREDAAVLQQYVANMGDLVADDAQAFDFIELSDRAMLFMAMRAGNGRIARTMSSVSLQLLRYFAMGVRNVRQRRELLQRWHETVRNIALRTPEPLLSHFEQTLRMRMDETRAALRAAA
jgi:DNA-binding GntR family transcriptional regulator